MSKRTTQQETKDRISAWRRAIEPAPLTSESQQVLPYLQHLDRVSPTASATQGDPNQRPQFSDEIITLRAGQDATAQSFRVRKDLFYNVATFFTDTSSSLVVIPADLTSEDPLVFGIFVNWLEERKDPIPYIPLQYTNEPWRSHAVAAWIFGNKIRATTFERFALSQFITNCAMADLSTWEYIERQAGDKSSLKRFSNHWVAWNHHLTSPGQSEYQDLGAAKLGSVVNDDTNDPRIFDLDHWYSACGDDINSSCIHDPLIREAAVNELVRSRKPPVEWGRDLETGQRGSQGGDPTSPSSSTMAASKTKNQPKVSPLPPRQIRSSPSVPKPPPKHRPKPPLPPRQKPTASTKPNSS